MVTFIDARRKAYGVEPICRVLRIAPSTYFQHKAAQRYPMRRSARALREYELKAIICRMWTENHQVYGPRIVWRQMGRDGRCAAGSGG
jgi:putative transposase